MRHSTTDSLPTYRCTLRRPDQPGNGDAALDETLQLKAANAVDAARLAHVTTSKAVIDVTRLDD